MKYVPTIMPILVLAAAAFATPVQAYLGTHGVVAAVLGSFAAIINHWLPSPAA
jgi:hypothetical protein